MNVPEHLAKYGAHNLDRGTLATLLRYAQSQIDEDTELIEALADDPDNELWADTYQNCLASRETHQEAITSIERNLAKLWPPCNSCGNACEVLKMELCPSCYRERIEDVLTIRAFRDLAKGS